MHFDVDDEDGFFAAKDALLQEFDTSLQAGGRSPDLASDADLMLDWKWGHADGELTWWKAGHLSELLLEWYPRKVSSTPDLLEPTIPSMQAFLGFLADTGRLSPASDPLEVLVAHLDGLRDDFLAAMGDSSKFGMAKSLFDSAGPDLDVSDRDAVQAFMDQFNARPFAERDAILGGAMDDMLGGSVGRRQFAPVVLASEDELAAAAAEAPWVQRLLAFAAWAGDGRKLTQKTNNLTLADARELLDVLDAPEVMDEQIGDRTFRTVSSTELPTVDLAYRWAREAGLVKVRHGRVSATAAGRQATGADGRAPDAPHTMLRRALWSLVLKVGVLRHFWADRDRYGFGWFADAVDDLVHAWLLELYAEGEVTIGALVEWAWDELGYEFDLDDLPADRLADQRRSVEVGIRRVLRTLEGLGVVRLDGVEFEPSVRGIGRPGEDLGPTVVDERGGRVVMTPLGVWATHGHATAVGDAPVVGELADLDAPVLLERAIDLPEQLAGPEVDAWVARRGEDRATAELAAALAGASQAGLALGLKSLLRIGGSAAPTVGALACDPRLAPYVVVWQVDALATDAASVHSDDPAMQVGVVAAAVDLWGPPAAGHWLGLVCGTDDPAGLADAVAGWWRLPGEHVTEALELVAGDDRKVVSKAARKALFRRRTAGHA